MRFAYFFMAEYASMYLICALAAILYLGGWYGPIPLPAAPSDVSIVAHWAEFVRNAGGYGSFSAWFEGVKFALTDSLSLKILAHEAVGTFNLLLKSFALYFVMIWVRWTLPRIRIDQVMYICLKVLLPFSLGCVLWALVQVAI